MEELRILLGKRIKEVRQEKNLTQEDLANLIDVDYKSISRIELGHSFPSRKLADIAKALNVKMPDLFDFDHLKEDIDFKKQYIIQALDEISEDKINVLYRFIKSMK